MSTVRSIVVGIAAAATVAVASAPAHAWESVCREFSDVTLAADDLAALDAPACDPAEGPNAARQRWIGPLDEHRAIFEETLARAGMSASFSSTRVLSGWSDGAAVDVGGVAKVTLVPTSFDRAARITSRAFTPGELAQLPDFSYALWDWAEGNETCPIAGIGADADACHDFATHMGPVNANHFLPQAGVFYAWYHRLALARAAECRALHDALVDESDRFPGFVNECEIEAISIEAVGQHYLQDAWSMGHMWQRWGSPELADFDGANEEKRDRAVLVALVSGLIHGSRGVLQRVPDWAGLDVNDAMCAPGTGVGYVGGDAVIGAGAGDDYLDELPSAQARQMFSCAAAGVVEVYAATAEEHGVLGAIDADLVDVDPLGPACFAQRATNSALLAGEAVNIRVAGQQTTLNLDSRTVSFMLPKVARASGEVPVASGLRNQMRLDLQRVVSVTRILAKEDPFGTDAADGGLGDFLGAAPNGAYLRDGDGEEPASYSDPALPWPGGGGGDARAIALARLFHKAHAKDWCQTIDESALASLRAHPAAAGLDAAGRAAACNACEEIGARHLRTGVDASNFDASAEPLCSFLATSPAYGYQPNGDVAAWCGCP